MDDQSVTEESLETLAEQGRRLRLRHNSQFYGSMKDETCGCDVCEWLVPFLALLQRAQEAERRRDNARFELQGLEHVRVKDNGYLIARAEAAEARERKLREELQKVGDGVTVLHEEEVSLWASALLRSLDSEGEGT